MEPVHHWPATKRSLFDSETRGGCFTIVFPRLAWVADDRRIHSRGIRKKTTKRKGYYCIIALLQCIMYGGESIIVCGGCCMMTTVSQAELLLDEVRSTMLYGVAKVVQKKAIPPSPFPCIENGSEPSQDQGQVNRYLASFMSILIWRYIRMEKGVRRGERSKGMDGQIFFLFSANNNNIGICVIPHQYRYGVQSLPLLHSNNTLPSSASYSACTLYSVLRTINTK